MSKKRSADLKRVGDTAFSKIEKVNSELFSLMYGAIVVQLFKECGDQNVDRVNQELHKMGYNIGVRLIDEFLVTTNMQTCKSFEDTIEVIAKVALRMFLGISGEVIETSVPSETKSLSIRLPPNNPFTDFVDLPTEYSELVYGNLLCGVIRGALEMVNLNVDCFFVQDVLTGETYSEISVVLKEQMQERIEVDL